MATSKKTLNGGAFLIQNTAPDSIFIPEAWTEEQQMIGDLCSDFIEKEITPILDRIDAQEDGLMESLMAKAGELGLLGVSIPEAYGGLGKDFVTSMLVTEKIGPGHSFAVAFAAHTGIGTLPILLYGNDAQKEKYIPKLATGEWKGAYCLTEPEAGSDANAGKAKATLSDDGKHYLLNGQKMWITNGGFADIFTVFAKIDDDENLSAFIVEKAFGGISLNAEERKMGIKGSSTRQVFFNDCKVPVENLLSSRGNGFKIAVNILNLGRIKLGGAALGAAKRVISQSVDYANQRSQFGRVIAKYGAIRYKLAEQAIRTYVTESAVYRASQQIEDATDRFMEDGMEEAQAKLKATEEFAVEAAIVKVHASEALDYVVDEGVQIYGGMGFSAEAPMDRSYRDSRINRIFEGTNEINRLLTVDMLLKRALKGRLDLLGPAKKVAAELMDIPLPEAGEAKGVLDAEADVVHRLKKAVLLTAGAAVQKLAQSLAKEQEVILYLADMLIEVYAAESVLLRVQQLLAHAEDNTAAASADTPDTDKRNTEVSNEEVSHADAPDAAEGDREAQLAMAKVYIYDAALKVQQAGRNALNAFAGGDEQRMLQMGLRRFTKTPELNTVALRRLVAARLIEAGRYCF